MDRGEIKSLAKEKIKGNLWTIWKPLLAISVIMGIVNWVGSLAAENAGVIGTIASLVLSIGAGLLLCAYTAYLLKFVRGENPEISDIIDCLKEKWLALLITSLLVSIFTMLWSLLFIIPGIIKGLAYAMAMYLVIDTDLSGNAAIKESMNMMDGYKWDYFVFKLSFIGWYLLGCITLYIAFIWVLPYIMVAEVIYYEKLREKKGMVTATASTASVSPEPTYSEPVKTEEPATPSLEDTVVGGDDDPIK